MSSATAPTRERPREPLGIMPYPPAPPLRPPDEAGRENGGPTRFGTALRLLAGMAALAALVPAHDLWPAQVVLLGLLLTVPGLALLAALGVPRPAIAATLVYVPAASLVALLVSGLAVNLVGPALGAEEPLRTVPLLIGVEVLCGALTIAAVARRPRGREGARVVAPGIVELWPLALPLAAAAGAARLTNGQGPELAIATTGACVGAIVFVLLAAPRLTRSQIALVLYGIGLALAWSFSLRSGFVYGFDISTEYQVVSGTGLAGIWETSHPDDAYGAMLSLTVLPAVLHEIAGISHLTLLKAVYPALFALFPVVIFTIARRFVAPRYAAAAAALVLVQTYFFQQIPAVARQEVALIAFAVLVAVLVDARIPRGPRLAFASLLSLSLVVSHYSTTYLAIALLGLTVVLLGVVSVIRRPGPRGGVVVAGTLLAMLAGAFVWYGPVTNSASNLDGFRDSLRSDGLQLLPNREAGEGLLTSYLEGNTTSIVDAAEYEELAAADYAQNRPFVVPLASADEPRYALRDAAPPSHTAVAPAAEDTLGTAGLVIQQLLNLIAVVAVLVLATRRRGPGGLRVLAIAGVSTLAVLALIRLSGTAASAYNQERAYLQAMVPLAVGLAFALQWGVRRMGRAGPAGVAAIAAGAALLMINATGLAGATLGSATTGNLADRGEDHERFYASAPELASARWVDVAKPPGELLYTDRYGQLRVLSQFGPDPSPLLDPTPRTLDRDAWVYASSVNVVEGRARAANSGHFATYRFPARFIADEFDTVYANGSSEVYHR